MSRLVVVSNRVAVPDDQPARAGGLAVALREALQKNGGTWFGWSGNTVEEPSDVPTITEAGAVTYATLDLTEKDLNEYYNGFANRTLWPLCHYRLDLAEFQRQDYAGYLRVNIQFAEKLVPLLEPDDMVWVHDYHFFPFAKELRRMGQEQRMGFFLHIPFPALEVVLALPSHARLGRSLCSYDVVGFQTKNDLRAFHDYIVHEAGGEVDGDIVRCYGRTLTAKAYPIGMDAESMSKSAIHSMRSESVKRLQKSLDGRDLIVGVERLDYSKGLPERFESYERFLDKYPDHHNKVEFLQIAPASRADVPEYQQIREELELLAGRVNGRYADFDWVPLNYLNKSFAREELAGFFRISRVGLVTPMRDGMNLVAKEYVASQNPHTPGVLVLSRFAGAARELDAALLVNPYDRDSVADAMHQALTMPLEERQERWEDMNRIVHENSLEKWREDFLKDLKAAPHG